MSEKDPIRLVEILEDEKLDFVVFQDGEEQTLFDSFGEAVDNILNVVGLDVGIVQAVGGGASRPVYLSVDGVIETLLEKTPDDDEVVVSRELLADTADAIVSAGAEPSESEKAVVDAINEVLADE
mgnify:CR=1 FL=1